MYNTGNEVPSSALEDMADNAQVFDGLVTQTRGTVTDRLGNVRRPFQQIVTDMGFNPVSGSFQAGATVTEYNQCLLDASTGTFYSWSGVLPKLVPAGSAPETAGGIGALLWVDRTDLMLRNDLAGSEGAKLVNTSVYSGVNKSLYDTLNQIQVSVVQFGAVGDGVHVDTKAFQDACIFINTMTYGGVVHVPNPPVEWLLDYPVFIQNNTEVSGAGPGCIIRYKNPTYAKGRGGFVIGSSKEANRDTAFAAWAAGTVPNATTYNDSFANPALKQYLRDNKQFIQAKNSSIHDVYLICDFDNQTDWGGYGINMVNSWNCHAWNIWGEGWCQLVGMGSDVVPETPSNHMCSATKLTVVSPDPIHTYYSVGFIANSTNCSISVAEQIAPCSDGTDDGSGVATNFVENCTIKNIKIPNLGATSSSEGLLLNNSKGCIIDDIFVGNANAAVSTFYTDSAYNDVNSPNVIGQNIIGNNCETVLQIGAKYARITGYKNVNTSYDIKFLNLNASNNVISGPNNVIYTPGDISRRNYLTNNTLENLSQKTLYLRPIDLLIQDPSNVQDWDTNKNVTTKDGLDLYFMWRVPDDVRAVVGCTVNATLNGNASARGTVITLSARHMLSATGNTGEAPIIDAEVTHIASNTSTLDLQVTLGSVLVEPLFVSSGLMNSHDIVIKLGTPTAYSAIHEIRIDVLS